MTIRRSGGAFASSALIRDQVILVKPEPTACGMGCEGIPSRCGHPVADLIAVLVLQHAAVGLDYLAGGKVVLIAGEQGLFGEPAGSPLPAGPPRRARLPSRLPADMLCLLVRVKDDLAGRTADIPHGQRDRQLAALGLGELARQ